MVLFVIPIGSKATFWLFCLETGFWSVSTEYHISLLGTKYRKNQPCKYDAVATLFYSLSERVDTGFYGRQVFTAFDIIWKINDSYNRKKRRCFRNILFIIIKYQNLIQIFKINMFQIEANTGSD